MKTGLRPCEAARRAKPPCNRPPGRAPEMPQGGTIHRTFRKSGLSCPPQQAMAAERKNRHRLSRGAAAPCAAPANPGFIRPCPCCRGFLSGNVLHPPLANGIKDRKQIPALWGQGVFHARRNLALWLPMYKAVGLQLLQRVGEHRVGDGRKHLLQFAKPHR